MGWFELAAGVGSTFTFETYIYDEEPSFRKRRRVSADEMEKKDWRINSCAGMRTICPSVLMIYINIFFSPVFN